MAQSKMTNLTPCWQDNHITMHTRTIYTAWDETGSNEIGTFNTYEEAKHALTEYAKTLDNGGK